MKNTLAFTEQEELLLRYYRRPRSIRNRPLFILHFGVLLFAGFGVWRFVLTGDQAWLWGVLTLLAYTVAGMLWFLVKHFDSVASILTKYEKAFSTAGETPSNGKTA